jgi:hypothetical protein
MLRAARRLLRDVRATSHVTLQHKKITGNLSHELHTAYLKNGFGSCVWASAEVVRGCRLARRGQHPVAVGGSTMKEFYNKDQLITFARAASGKWLPAQYHRELMLRQWADGVLRHRSNVWLCAAQTPKSRLNPGETPIAVHVNSERELWFNASQVVPPMASHMVLRNGAALNLDDQVVLQHVAAREGFTSQVWVSARHVGMLDGVISLAHVSNRRYGTVPMYNMDQLVWPIPVPAEPHSWAKSGVAMKPHEQVFLEKIRQQRGFTSRQWAVSEHQVKLNNARPGAAPVLLQTLMKSVEVLNRDQLLVSPATL